MTQQLNEPTVQSVRDMAYAFQKSRVLLSAFELGLFSALGDEDLAAEEVAMRAGADAGAVARLLNAQVALGLVRKSEGRFSNTPFASEHLVEGKPGYMAGLMHGANQWHTWSTLTEVVRTGKSMVPHHVADRGVEWLRAFIAAMHWRGVPQAPETLAPVDLRGVKRILDVGGGSGAYCMEMVRREPGAQAVVFDLPEVVGLTQEYVAAAGLTDRVTTQPGDYTREDLGRDYDLVFLCAIVHSNSYQANRSLVAKCARALSPGGRLVIVDYVMSEDRTQPPEGAMFSINMLLGTEGGDNYTETEMREWLRDAGLEFVSRTDLPFGTSVLIARKP
ncbi:MAG: methyltransferase domain-containing protein [Fimbriimonadia bacterium]|jgi:SAM-dependent methyltransferase